MFKLPVCPHCKTVYHYRDTKNAVKQKEIECYHCQKKIKAGIFPDILVSGVILLLLCILTNLLMLSRMNTLNLYLLFIVTLLYIMLFILTVPFFVRFRKDGKDEKNGGKRIG